MRLYETLALPLSQKGDIFSHDIAELHVDYTEFKVASIRLLKFAVATQIQVSAAP